MLAGEKTLGDFGGVDVTSVRLADGDLSQNRGHLLAHLRPTSRWCIPHPRRDPRRLGVSVLKCAETATHPHEAPPPRYHLHTSGIPG